MNSSTVRNVQRYTTSVVPPPQRLAFWNDVAVETYGPLVVDGDRRRAFDGEIARLHLNGCALTSARSTPAIVRYQRASQGACSHTQSLNVQLQVTGCTHSTTGDRTADLRQGDFVLFDPSRAYSVGFVDPTHVYVLQLPRTELAERGLDLEPFVGHRVAGDRGAAAMLSSFMLSLRPHFNRFEDAWSQPTSEVLFTLLEMVYRPQQRVTETLSAPEKVLERARECIQRNLCDPAFDVLSVATVLGITPRYLQILFARAGTTPSRYLLQRRLQLAASRLRKDPSASISTIAFAVGFNDLSHFARVFRRQYGVTAREFRARG